MTLAVGKEETRQSVVLAGLPYVMGLWFVATAMAGGPFPEGSTLLVGAGNILDIQA